MLSERLEQIAAGLDHGVPLASIETELIEGAWELDEDERAALWLFAWSYRPGQRGLELATAVD